MGIGIWQQKQANEEWSVNSMGDLLDHDNHKMRTNLREFLSKSDIMKPRYNISLSEERELALQRLQVLLY